MLQSTNFRVIFLFACNALCCQYNTHCLLTAALKGPSAFCSNTQPMEGWECKKFKGILGSNIDHLLGICFFP